VKKSDLKKIVNQIVQESIKEKKIGFNRGPEYSEETEDLLNDFAKSTEMINKELAKKVVNNDDPKVQEILNILDNNLDSEFIEDLETVYNLIQELPDKPTEKPKVGFREDDRKNNPGLWANMHKKRKSGKTMSKKGSKAFKSAKKAGKKINKDEGKRANTPSGDMAYTQTIEEDLTIQEVLDMEVIDENITEAKYKGKTVQLNKPTRGDSKKFKVYVNSGKKNADGSIKVKKVNFGHGGTTAKKAGQKTMKIRKSNPKARSAFRARHNCDNPGPKTMARYWSCKKW